MRGSTEDGSVCKGVPGDMYIYCLPYTMAVWRHLSITSQYYTYDLKFIERVPCINTCSSVWENVIIPRNTKRYPVNLHSYCIIILLYVYRQGLNGLLWSTASDARCFNSSRAQGTRKSPGVMHSA